MRAAPSRYAVAGNPVAHSQSPFIHAEFARQTGEALSYDRLLCPLDAFAATVRAFAAGGGARLQRHDAVQVRGVRACRRAHAARRPGRGLQLPALRRRRLDRRQHRRRRAGAPTSIGNAGCALRGARVLLVGAGGGAAGALGPLLAAAPAELVVANRTDERAAELVARHARGGRRGRHAAARSAARRTAGRAFDIVVNASASSVGGAGVPVDGQRASSRHAGARHDVRPAGRARSSPGREAHGAIGRDGLGMLVEQAAEAFLFWRGVRPRTADVLRGAAPAGRRADDRRASAGHARPLRSRCC